MTAEPIINPNPKPVIPCAGRGDPKALGKHLYERMKDGPPGVLVHLQAIGPIAVNHGVQAAIHANTLLVACGTYLALVPSKKVVERRPTQGSEGPDYGTSHATVLICCLRECE